MYIHINSLNDPCFQLLQEESCKERSCREAPGKRQKAATDDVAEGHADAQASAISSSPRPVTRRWSYNSEFYTSPLNFFPMLSA